MKGRLLFSAALTALIMLSSCGQDQPQSAQVNYNEVKSMVVDILKTEDGQKAILEAVQKSGSAAASPHMQILATGQGDQLRMAVKEVMSDPAYAASLKEAMIDPKFAGDFARAITTEHKKVLKQLMKDPEYQQALIDIFKDPQMQGLLLQTMKSSEYRTQIVTIMKESLQSPLFQQDMLKLMEKALEEQAKPKSDAEKGAKGSKNQEKDQEKDQDNDQDKDQENLEESGTGSDA